MKQRIFTIAIIFCLMSLAACSSGANTVEKSTPQPSEQTLPNVISLWIPPFIPSGLLNALKISKNILTDTTEEKADIRLDVGNDYPVSTWVYALVAPFPTVADEVSLKDLQGFWRGDSNVNFPAKRIIMEGGTQAIFTKLWGNPSVSIISSVSVDMLLSTAWQEKTTWAIIPFEQIEPKWKVIRVEGQSPIHKDFNLKTYPLSVPFTFVGKSGIVEKFYDSFGPIAANPIVPSTNRDPNKMTVVAETGVTALVRGTAYLMEQKGITYPAQDIGEILRNADITHISNEVPFWPSCPKPFSNPENDRNMVFCSKPEYIQLLEAVGTDVVELTGDHFRDWGPEPMLYTLDMYDQRGWKYYGGGRNIDDAEKPALFENNGNKIAFLGCNAKLIGYATASATNPGAVHCDLDVMAKKIQEVVQQGYNPIFTFQHIEYYAYKADPVLVKDFHKVAEAGAVIVGGSQAHMPGALEFYRGATLHYGLGNLFFDQYTEGLETRKAFIDMHIFYNNKYINTELITMEFVDMARPRLMTAAEREYLLKDVFFASGW